VPLTGDAKKVMASMVEQYGPEKGKQVFYATANKQKREERTWQKKSCFRAGKTAVMVIPNRFDPNAPARFDPNDPYHRQWAEEGAEAEARHVTRFHRDMRYDEALHQEPLRNMLGITGGMLFGAGLGELGNVAFQPTLPHEAAIAAGGLE
jgi:rRNA maturation protein Nop10